MGRIKFFVEGPADKTFFLQYINYVFGEVVSCEDFIETGGWQALNSTTIINQIAKNTADGGINIVLFDADNDAEKRRKELEKIKEETNISFELFLLPNNQDAGALESLLEQIINPSNQCIIDCWHRYEDDLSKQIIPWKNPQKPTAPSNKSMIYGYLEALLGTSKSQKEKIKERKRDYTEKNHWDLDSEKLNSLKSFLCEFLGKESTKG